MRPLACLLALLGLGTFAACDHGASAAPEQEAAAPAGPTEVAAATPAETSPLPLPDLGYNARQGRAVYRHYCLTCHGEEGHGDGFNAYNLDPRPRDLADPAFQAQRNDDDLATVIRSGGGAAGLSTAMPPWGRTLIDRQIRDVVDYIRTLHSEDDEEADADE